MNDPRWDTLADVLVNYSTRARSGEKALITMMEVETFPLARAVHAQAIKIGAFPHVEFQSAYLERDLMRYGSQAQIDRVPEMQAHGMEWADVYIGLRGARNPHEFAGISPDRIAAHKRAMGHISTMRTDLTRWVLVRVPNESLAQQAEMSLDEMADFFFSATLRDWAAESRRYHELKEIFQAAEIVRVVGRDTDLTFSTKGRTYAVGEGRRNMPDGEIFTAPVDDSATGHIYFEFPAVYSGQRVDGIRLEFAEGQVIKATAKSNEQLLYQLLRIEGAKRIGEFGVGTNFGITRFCYDILYDEKIGGTIHIALGRAYANCGGINKSTLHWDIIKELRQQGEIYLDGRRVFENGRFLV